MMWYHLYLAVRQWCDSTQWHWQWLHGHTNRTCIRQSWIQLLQCLAQNIQPHPLHGPGVNHAGVGTICISIEPKQLLKFLRGPYYYSARHKTAHKCWCKSAYDQMDEHLLRTYPFCEQFSSDFRYSYIKIWLFGLSNRAFGKLNLSEHGPSSLCNQRKPVSTKPAWN